MSQSSDLDKGSKTVKVNKVPACLKGSNFSKSVGDQAGTLHGVISNKTGGVADPINYSFDVKIEGKNTVRNMDLFMSNNKNTPPAPLMQAPVIIALTADDPEEEEKCEYCDKEVHKFATKSGSNIGNGQTLRKNIIKDLSEHPWYTGDYSLQAHHVICSESMDDDDWSEYASIFGYDINHENNGIMLPYKLELACQLHAPLHRGNHDQGIADGIPYPDRIEEELEKIANEIRSGKYCDNPKALVDKLDDFSESALKKIDKFRWTITSDGKDYQSNENGCAGVSSIKDKPDETCPDRHHQLTKPDESTPIPRKTQPLKIGT